MQVGDYVRFKTLSREIKIGKAIEIIEPDNSNEFSPKKYNVYDLDNNEATVDDYIIKSSPNIIDLIEVGDYVNGSKVQEIGEGYVEIEEYSGLNNDMPFVVKTEDIKSIVTKEQFESMEYKIGE